MLPEQDSLCTSPNEESGPLANNAPLTVLGMLGGPEGADPSACMVWFRFRMLRRCLANRPDESARTGRLLDLVIGGAPGHGPVLIWGSGGAPMAFVGVSQVCIICL